jgi:hypothetical protein
MMMMNTNNSMFAMLIVTVLVVCSVVVNGFQQQQQQQSPTTIRTTREQSKTTTSSTAVYGIFDKLVKGMESGYAGGEESPYAKIKEKDKQKQLNQKKKSVERKNKGYTELKDVKKKSFVKLKYNGNKNDDKEEPKVEKKKLFGLF